VASHGYYGTAHWRRLRYAALARDNFCCTVSGCGKPAVIVDHIETRPAVGHPTPADRLDNLRSLCAPHDAQIKEHRGGRGRGGRPVIKGCDTQGWPFSQPGDHAMRKPLATPLAVVLCCALAAASTSARAASATATLSITVLPPLSVAFSPASPSIGCGAAPGTVVAAVATAGGDGNGVSLAISGDTGDFTLSGSNVVVGPNGVAPANCGKTNAVTVSATQQ
jgi:hypothetical protein